MVQLLGFCGEHSSQLDNIEFIKEVEADYISCISSFVPTSKRIFANMEKDNFNQLKHINSNSYLLASQIAGILGSFCRNLLDFDK